MHAARDRKTQQIVEAEDLKLLEAVDTYGYSCHGHECEIQVFPRSYRPENLLRAHFYAKISHTGSCDVAGEDEVRERGKKSSVANELETSPGLSPSRLQLIDAREVVGDDPLAGGAKSVSERRSSASLGECSPRPAGRRAANSIRPICRAFIEFPYDRHLPLHIGGIRTNTYQMVFKRLRAEGFEHFSEQRIFYAELAWRAAYESGQNLIILLNAGEWADKKLSPYQIVVDMSDWSKTAKSRLVNEMEISRLENIASVKQGRARRTYVFFIGTQDLENPSEFLVSDQRLICTVHGDLVFPRRK